MPQAAIPLTPVPRVPKGNDDGADLGGRPPFLEVHDAVVTRAGKTILAIDDFALAEGESVALIGPNGSGKSTFIGLVTREVAPLYRERPPVLFRGSARRPLIEIRSAVGIVSATMQDQISVHLPALSVVLGGFFGSLGVPKQFSVSDEQLALGLAALDELGLGEFAERDILTLSSGEARRVLIARALVNTPSILILDEPCTGLDPAGMYAVRETMERLIRRGRSLMLVTHYPEDIPVSLRRLVLLDGGRIRADGPKEELLTDEAMTALFKVPLHVEEHAGIYRLQGIY